VTEDVLHLRGDLPVLRDPILVAAFEGWNDAGECATLALSELSRAADAEPFAHLEPEAFYDFQQTRPSIRTDGEHRVLDWPRTELSAAVLPGARGDLVLLTGPEPNLRWRTFAEVVVDLSRRLDVRLVLTVGALQVDVPHTRPVPITMTSADPGLVDELELSPSTYEGPTGITGVLHTVAAGAGLPSLSMWAGVPHYLAATPYLRGGLVLAERIATILGTELALERLARDAATQNDEIAELIAHDEELEEYVGELEQRAAGSGDDDGSEVDDEPQVLPESDVSGEELAAELERYLRGER
jgi:hypothetical protein